MKIKPYKLTKANVHYIYTTGVGGRGGHLLKVLPLQDTKPNVENPPGPHIAQLLHITKEVKKQEKINKPHFTLELHVENGVCAFYIWTEDAMLAKKVREVYTTCYPGIEVVDEHEKCFIDLNEGDLLCSARLRPSTSNYMPIDIVNNGELWNSFIELLQPDEPTQKAVLQIIVNPKARSKMGRVQRYVWKRKQVQNPTPKFSALTTALDTKAHEAPYEIAIRIVCLGRSEEMLVRKFTGVLDVFNRINSDSGGNQFKRKIYTSQQVKFLNAVEDRNIKIFVGTQEGRFLLGTTELGHNFLAMPCSELKGLESLNVVRPPVPQELLERESEEKAGKIMKLSWETEMDNEELKANYEEYLKRQQQLEEQEKVMNERENEWYGKITKEIADKTVKLKTENAKKAVCVQG